MLSFRSRYVNGTIVLATYRFLMFSMGPRLRGDDGCC
jgi:hypothetical protein